MLPNDKEEKDLGITFSEDFTFSQHISAIAAKANSRLGLIKRTFKFKTRHNMSTIQIISKANIRIWICDLLPIPKKGHEHLREDTETSNQTYPRDQK